MNSHRQTPATRARPIAMRSRAMFGTMLLILTLMLGAQAQAEPGAASQALQLAKQNFAIARLQFQSGQTAASVGNAAQASSSFISAQVSALRLLQNARQLVSENQDSLDRGLYVNRDYQEQAVLNSRLLSTQVSLLNSYLSLLAQNPLSVQLQIDVLIRNIEVSATLARLENAMRRAQQ
jgi:hypothetical protein